MSTMEPIQSGLRLRVLEGGTHSETLRLERSVISLGRSTPDTVASPSYLTFPEPTVSRLHAVMTWESGVRSYLLHHRSQTNPTIINNVAIGAPQLLKVGDQIILGRLIMTVEPDVVETAPVAVPVQPEFAINAQTEGAERTFSAPLKSQVLELAFASDRTPSSRGEKADFQEVRLPARTRSGLRFQFDSALVECTVEPTQEQQPSAVRSSVGRAGAVLTVPLRYGHAQSMLSSDVVIHQGYRIWLGSSSACPDSGTTLGHETQDRDGQREPTPKVTLKFLNGPWQDATITLPASGIATLPLGPGDIGFPHRFPLSSVPRCEIVLQNATARLRALEVNDEQFLEVDGDLVFGGESVPLLGGSRISLGEAEFLWLDGSERRYQRYSLKHGSQRLPIRKAVVRIGTAAHCEIMLSDVKLPPVIGAIDFTGPNPVYRHLDISGPVRVDKDETSVGLSATLSTGSVLELRPEVHLVLEEQQS